VAGSGPPAPRPPEPGALGERGPQLTEIFGEARSLGFLGPEPVAGHIRHARVLATHADPPESLLDLGSGAGVPGLIFALIWPETETVLLDGSQRRSAFAKRAVERLGLGERVRVRRGRAEVLGHDTELRERFGLVVARSFARPAVTAECGSPFVRQGGTLLVTEPPEDAVDRRWPTDGLATLGLVLDRRHAGEGVSSISFRKERELEERYPRRTGVPAKRPLWI
jgi:16S rRNA (guanine527-N7)-methyltransferase